VEAILDAFVQGLHLLPGPLDYLLVALIAFGETAILLGLIVPGEVAMVFAGILAGRGALSLPALIVAATVGAVLGDAVGWFVGRRWGVGVLARWRFTRRTVVRRMDRARGFFDRHGGKAIFLGRFVGGVRTFIPVAAGVAHVPYRRFVVWDVPASLAWAAASLALGVYGGPYIVRALEEATPIVAAVAVGLLALGLVVWWVRRRPPARQGSGAATSRRRASGEGASGASQ
jgi:membrane protein DedA with SNARE-associated domain